MTISTIWTVPTNEHDEIRSTEVTQTTCLRRIMSPVTTPITSARSVPR